MVDQETLDNANSHKRHWSFVVTDKRYIYPLVAMLTIIAIAFAIAFRDPTLFSRAGNFVVAIGVWMSMRFTFREGINRHKDFARSKPILANRQLNASFFNEIAFSIGDARLQIHGLAIVIYGSFVGSFGDLLLKGLGLASL